MTYKQYNQAINDVESLVYDNMDEFYPSEDTAFIDQRTAIINVINAALQRSYILVQWPESQLYMDNPRAIFCGGSEDMTGDGAYFVPLDVYFTHDSEYRKI